MYPFIDKTIRTHGKTYIEKIQIEMKMKFTFQNNSSVV